MFLFALFAVSACACVRLACSAALACGAALACCLVHPAMARGIQKLPLSIDLIDSGGAFISCALAGKASGSKMV